MATANEQARDELRAEFCLLMDSERVFERLYAISSRLGLSQDARWDLCQETLLKAYSSFDKYDPDQAPLLAWVGRILHNTYVNSLRRPAPVAVELQDDATPVWKLVDPTSSVDDRVFLAQVIGQLDDRHRVVVMLDAEGFEYSEIATALGIPVGTVRSRLHNARAQLRDWMRDSYPDR